MVLKINKKGVRKKMGIKRQIILNEYVCERCNHDWIPRREETPIICPKCKSPYWNKARPSIIKQNVKNEQ